MTILFYTPYVFMDLCEGSTTVGYLLNKDTFRLIFKQTIFKNDLSKFYSLRATFCHTHFWGRKEATNWVKNQQKSCIQSDFSGHEGAKT